MDLVSIPFNRESISKEKSKKKKGKERKKFRFPSTGKAYLKSGRCRKFYTAVKVGVSIPFNRESISKVIPHFQSNVKRKYVSIPFNRESISKDVRINTLYSE